METQAEGGIVEMRENLEEQELSSPDGIAPVDVYKKLMTIYLIENDLPNAKFLWKRTPTDLKVDSELSTVWKIGQFMWKREFSNVYATINGQEWTVGIQELIDKLRGNLRKHISKLVSEAYSVIKFDELSKLLGLDDVQLVEFATQNSWTVDTENKFVKIPARVDNVTLDSEDNSAQLLYRLTNYVSFLEN